MSRLVHFFKIVGLVFFCLAPGIDINSQTTFEFVEYPRQVCEGRTYKFSCSNVGADSYTWSLPSGFSIDVGGVIRTGEIQELENTVYIHVNSFSSSAIEVKAITSGVASTPIRINLSLNLSECKLDEPRFLEKSKYICQGGAGVIFKVEEVLDAKEYKWILPAYLECPDNPGSEFTTTIPEITVKSKGSSTSGRLPAGQIIVQALPFGSPVSESNLVRTDEIFIIPQPVISIEKQDVTSCAADNGSLTIKDLAPLSEYLVSYAQGTVLVGPQIILSSDKGEILIQDLPIGEYSNFVVEAGGCSVNEPTNPKYNILAPAGVQINGVGFSPPMVCKGTGSLELNLTGAINNENFDIDIKDDEVIDYTKTATNNIIKIDGLPVGFKIDDVVKITSKATGCEAEYNAEKGFKGEIVNPQFATIDTVIIIDPQYCNAKGQVQIKLTNVTSNQNYMIDLNNNKSWDRTNRISSNQIVLEGIEPNTDVTGLLIQDEKNCRDSVLYGRTIKAPVAPSVSAVDIVNPTVCGGTGSLKVKVTNGVENDIYSIRFNQDASAFLSNIKLADNTLQVGNIPSGTIVNNFEIVNIATHCNASYQLNGIITDSPASFTIDKVVLNQPLSCNELGSLEINLTNITDGEKMGIDLNNDLVPEDSIIAKSNKITLSNLPNGYKIKNILLTKFSTKCNAVKIYTGTINPPYLPDVSLTDFKPVCNSEEPFSLKGGAPTGGTYFVDDKVTDTFIPSVLGVGSHTVVYKYTDVNNCSNSDTTELIVEKLPEVIIEGADQTMCPNLAQASYTAMIFRDHAYLWEAENGEIIKGQSLPKVEINWDKDQDLKKRLKLKITNSISGCFDTASVSVNFVDTIAPLFIECSERITLKAEGGSNGWEATFSEAEGFTLPEAEDNCSETAKLTFSVNNSGFHELSEFEGYKVDALKPASVIWQASDLYENTSECVTKIDFDFIEVVPSAFSPNDDATNNTWEIDFLYFYPNSVVKVYNRWGIKVFESEKGYPVPWDGTCNGKKVPVDSYYYSISIGDDNSKELKGDVTVIY